MADCPHTIGVEFGTRIIEVTLLNNNTLRYLKFVPGVRAKDQIADLGHCWAGKVWVNYLLFPLILPH